MRRILTRFVPFGGVCVAMLAMLWSAVPVDGRELANDELTQYSGGSCPGATPYQGSKSCEEATMLCKGRLMECHSQTMVAILGTPGGTQVPKDKVTKNCVVCGNSVCSTVSITTSTKKACGT